MKIYQINLKSVAVLLPFNYFAQRKMLDYSDMQLSASMQLIH